jgi:tetratricopeptide (TPR) repeat protein
MSISLLRDNRLIWTIYGIFIALVAVIYFASLSELMADVDDEHTFHDNVAVAQDFTYLFSSDKEVGSGRLTADFFRFIAYLLVGNQPGSVHLFLVVVHTLTSLLLARLAFRLGLPLNVSLLSGLLFLVNVAQFRAVHWIAALDYPLALLWGCLTLLAYLRYRDQPQPLKLALFYLSLLLSLLTHLVIAFVLPFFVYLLWRQQQSLHTCLRHFAWPTILSPLVLYGVLSSTSKATTTWWSIERYAADGGVELLMGCARMLLWLLGRMATTAYWLPLPLYQRQEWELYVGAIFLVLLLGLIWKRIYPLDAWALWILMALVPFALLTEDTIGALLAGPSRYVYLATGGWAVMLGWSLVELGHWVSRRIEAKSDYVLAGLLALILVSSYVSLKKVEALSFYMSGRNYIADEETDKGVAQMRRALKHAPEVLALEDVYPRLCLALINKPGEFERVAKEGLKVLPQSARLNLYMYAFTTMTADSSSQKQILDYLAKGKRYAATNNTVNVPMTLATAFNNLGHGFQTARDFEQAVIAYRYSLQYLPNRFNTLVNFAYALFDANKVQEAKEITQRAAQINSQEPRVMYLTALILQAGGKTAEALALAREAMRLKPLAELFYLASFSYHRLGQYDQAAAMLEEGIRRKGETPNLETYKRLANYYHKSGRRDDAINAYSAALQLAPDDAAARTNLAWVLYLNGQVKEAITHSLRALQKRPISRTVFNLGLFYLSNGEIDKAKATYALAVEQFGAAAGEEIGAAHNLKNLAKQGIQAEAAREILKTHWHQ